MATMARPSAEENPWRLTEPKRRTVPTIRNTLPEAPCNDFDWWRVSSPPQSSVGKLEDFEGEGRCKSVGDAPETQDVLDLKDVEGNLDYQFEVCTPLVS